MKSIVEGKRWCIAFFGFITFFLLVYFYFFFKYCADVCFIYLFIFNIVLTWKIIGASKVSVLYIYIYRLVTSRYQLLQPYQKNTQ